MQFSIKIFLIFFSKKIEKKTLNFLIGHCCNNLFFLQCSIKKKKIWKVLVNTFSYGIWFILIISDTKILLNSSSCIDLTLPESGAHLSLTNNYHHKIKYFTINYQLIHILFTLATLCLNYLDVNKIPIQNKVRNANLVKFSFHHNVEK